MSFNPPSGVADGTEYTYGNMVWKFNAENGVWNIKDGTLIGSQGPKGDIGNTGPTGATGSSVVPVAGYSLTGVAAFNINDFGVGSTGYVSLTGDVARTNVANVFTLTNTFSGGISANSGLTASGSISTYSSLFARNTADSKRVEVASRDFSGQEGTKRNLISSANDKLHIFSPGSSIVFDTFMLFGAAGLTYKFAIKQTTESGEELLPEVDMAARISLESYNNNLSSIYTSSLVPDVLTTNRTYTLPNQSGTVALTANIPSFSVSSFNGVTGAISVTGSQHGC